MKLFEEPAKLRRIAAYCGYEFPIASEHQAYEQLDALAAQLHATYRCLHSVVADPEEQPSTVRHRFGTGLLVLDDPQMQCNDVEHLRATLPRRFDSLIGELAGAVGISRPLAVAQPDLQAACSETRWIRGWSADLVVSVGLSQFALHSIVATHLLDLPRLLVLDTLPSNSPLIAMLSMYAHQASWILAATEDLRSKLVAYLGDAIADKVFVRGQGDNLAPPQLLAAIQQRIGPRRNSGQPSLGPEAAFRTCPPDRASPDGSSAGGVPHSGAQPDTASNPTAPLLVLGAERTGTNLLVNMLTVHPRIRLANEIFNPRLIKTDVLPWLGGSRDSEKELRRIRHARPQQLFEVLLQEGREQGATYAGFKLLYYHGLVDDRVTDMLLDHEDLAIVHLLREQRLERFASLVRALKSDTWSAQGNDKTSPQGAVEINLRAMATDFVQTTQFEQRYRALLKGHRVLEFDYADLSINLTATMQHIGEWLEVDLTSLRPRTMKTGAKNVREGIANWQQLCSALAGTCWSGLTESAS